MSDLDRDVYKLLVQAHAENRDFADWLTHIMAVVTTRVGGINELIRGRPGSWESAQIADWMQSAGVEVIDMHYQRYVDVFEESPNP